MMVPLFQSSLQAGRHDSCEVHHQMVATRVHTHQVRLVACGDGPCCGLYCALNDAAAGL